MIGAEPDKVYWAEKDDGRVAATMSPSGQTTPNGKEEIAIEPIHSQKEANWAKLWEAKI